MMLESAEGLSGVDPLSAAEQGQASNTTGAHLVGGGVGGEGWVTDPTQGLTPAQVQISRAEHGTNEIPVPSTPLYMMFVRQFFGFMPLLIEFSAIVSIAVQDYANFGITIAMPIVNGLIGFREELHAKKSLDELSSSIESESTVLRDGGKAVTIKSSELVPGDIILLVGGTVIPADSRWVGGDVMSIDTASLTGEPIPRKYPSADHGDVMLSGTTVRAGECYAQVAAIGSNTEIGRAQSDVMKDKAVRIVSVFQRKLMIAVQGVIAVSMLFVVAVLLVQGLVHGGFKDDLQRTILDAVSILISAIPVATPLVIQVNMALGAAYLAKKHHAIVTSIPALQDIASMSILCSDKTGTLTTANMSIIADKIHPATGFTRTDVLLCAFLCSNADKKDDPIDRAVVQAFEADPDAKAKLERMQYKQETLVGFNPEVKRTVGFVTCGTSGGTMSVAKGLPAKIIDTESGGLDNHEIQWKVEQSRDRKWIENIADVDQRLSHAGYKTIGVAVCEQDARTTVNPKFRFVGLLPMLDPPREDTSRTIKSLHHANISVKMITGDHVNVGKETAKLIGLGTDIHPGEAVRSTDGQAKNKMIWEADGFATVLPSDKREVVLTLRNEYGVVTGMTGDGVNDAAALSAAQVGIAVEGATDAAKNAADLILTEPGLSPIYGAVIESRRIFARVKSYVVYRIAASITLVLTLSVLTFVSGCAVDSMLLLILALMIDISMIPVAYDNADATSKPQMPNAGKLVSMALYFGLVQTGLALFFFYVIEETQHLGGQFDLAVGCNEQTNGFIWLHLVLATEFLIFSARAPTFFFKSAPSIYLLASVFVTAVVGSFVAGLARGVSASSIEWIWFYNMVTFVVVDAGKVWFKQLIGEAPGEVIRSDALLEEDEQPSEERLDMEKKERYLVHTQAIMKPDELQHTVELTEARKGIFSQFRELRTVGITNGFVRRRRYATPLLAEPDSPPKLS